jgi:hypothetical protein
MLMYSLSFATLHHRTEPLLLAIVRRGRDDDSDRAPPLLPRSDGEFEPHSHPPHGPGCLDRSHGVR